MTSSYSALAHVDDRSSDHDVSCSLRRAAAALLDLQRDDGSWQCDTDIGPVGLAAQLVVERLFGRLEADDARRALRYFERRQRCDGSFAPYPGAVGGSLTVTALCWAAMQGLGIPQARTACEHAFSYIARHGGLAAVRQAFAQRGDPAALFLVAAGHLEADFLPRLPPGIALAAHGRILQSRVHAGNVMTMLVLAALAERHRSVGGGLFAAARRALGGLGIAEYLCRWQNGDGSWNGSPLQTSLILLGLHAAGMTPTDRPIKRALAWLEGMKRRRDDELDVSAMDNDVWSTALCTLALHEAAQPVDSAALDRAVRYLLSCQTRAPMPRENQRKRGAPLAGGWPFQRGNDTMPDCDDTGVVLAVLSRVTGTRATREMFETIDRGVSWLRGMQNPDGGFPTFVWGLPSKRPGPMFTEDLPIRLDDPQEVVRSFFEPVPEYGDPALEGVTGRVLWGLGAAGVRRNDPAVCRAIDFLRAQQCSDGSWWGRWKACYLAETATILMGLGAVGEDMRTPYVRRAVEWILGHQNRDGGFGEGPDAYRNASLAGCGPSTPAVTAYVVLGLLAAGEARAEATMTAVRWLVANQSEDGLWDNAGWLHTFVPPDLLYTYVLPAQALPVVALARWKAEMT